MLLMWALLTASMVSRYAQSDWRMTLLTWVPASFDPRRRDYGFRQVERLTARVSAPEPDPHDPMAELSADDHNPMAELSADDHDPMAELEEANPCS